MALFVVIPTSMEAEIAKSVADKLPGKFHRLPKGEYLVSFAGTSKDLSDALGITDGSRGHAVVASLSGYYGRAPNDIWEWLAQNGKP